MRKRTEKDDGTATYIRNTHQKREFTQWKNLYDTYHASLEVLLGELIHRIDEVGGRVEISVRALGRAGVADNAHVALQRWEEKGEEIGEREKREKSTVVRKYDSSDEKNIVSKAFKREEEEKRKGVADILPATRVF